MKRLFILLATVGILATSCSPEGGLDDDNSGNLTEQPDGGDQGGEDNPGNPDGGDQDKETIFITDSQSDIVIEAKGSAVVVTVATNLEYSVKIPDVAQSWLSVADTRAIRMEKLTFTIAKNETNAERKAVVKLLGSDNAELQSLSFVQKGASAEEEIPTDKTQAIKFQDETTKLLCTLHWDENKDGELSYEEAAAVIDLGTAFKGYSILAFAELKYFTSLENIADSAFEGCAHLLEITLPERLATIGRSAFSGCTNLRKIAIPKSVTAIGGEAFNGCTSLTSINSSDLAAWCKIEFTNPRANPLCYDGNLYLNGELVTNLVIPNGVTSIENYTFSGCASLTSVTIPNGVTSIGNYTFSHCTSLTSVTIPDSVTSIGDFAFSRCTSLTSITIPDSVTKIGEGTFSGSLLTSVTIGNGVTSIENYTFSDCTSLTSVTIPDSVTSIGNSAFYRCTSLTSITIPDSVTEIGEGAFCGCTSLTSITIPDSVTSIGYQAFSGSSLESVTIPNSVTSIESSAFSYCASLTSVTIPNSITSIENWTFAYCTSLKSVTIPDSVTSIGELVFSGCISLTSVTIGNGVTSIGGWAFDGCTGELIINSKIVETDYTYNTFNNKWLEGSKFYMITIGKDITKIGNSAFRQCTSLTSITIPDSVTSIGNSAFSHCASLTSVTIGNGVTSIGNSAFRQCTSLKKVYCKPITPPTGGDGMFDNNAPELKIYVPQASVSTYKSAAYWMYYASDIVGYDF